jgi:phage gp29-like protein
MAEPVPTDIPAEPTLGEAAVVGPQDIGAIFSEDLRVANDEILRTKGAGDLVIYAKVLTDAQCYSTFKQLRTDIISRETHVEPGGDRPIDKEASDDLELQLARIGWDQVTRKMLTGLWYGYSVGEDMYSVTGSHVNLDAILVRKARRFRFDKNGDLRLIRRDNPTGSVMPKAKFWTFRADADDDDDPYPLGLGYYCYWPVWFKRNMMRYWALWGEKFASPTPVVKYTPGATEEQRKKALALAKQLLMGGSIAMPNTLAFELLEALARAGDDYEKFCKYVDALITKIILCQTMTTDNGSSLAQGQVHAEVKAEVSKSYADLICESFMRGPGTWLTTWNYPGAALPKLWRDYSESEDLKAAADRDKSLNDIGYRPTAERMQEVYGAGYEPVKAPPPAVVPPQLTGTAPAPPAVAFAEPAPAPVVGPADDAVERILALDGWQKVIGDEVDEIVRFCEGAASLEEVRNKLADLQKTNPDAVTESLARVMFAANVAGQVDAEIDGNPD